MPLYEEKLICPFAVRFSQERIKEVFQDGREVAAALAQIEARPSSGEYDLVLHAPFPAIEILRWCPRHSVASDGEHWYTLDNRRLFCLQKAAAAHWPKRVAATVQVLYNDAGFMWRKYDSTSCGLSVNIGRCLEAIVARWDWSAEVAAAGAASGAHAAALAVVAADDRRTSVDALAAAPEETDSLTAMLARFSAGLDAPAAPPAVPRGQAPAKPGSVAAGCPTPSTNDFSDESDSASDQAVAVASAARRYAAELEEYLCGSWEDERGGVYSVQSRGEGAWFARVRAAGGKRFAINYSREDGLLWWGSAKTHFLDPADVVSGTDHVQWYAAGDQDKRRPRFTWRWHVGKGGGGGGEGGRQESHGRSGEEVSSAAAGAKAPRSQRRARRGKAQDNANRSSA